VDLFERLRQLAVDQKQAGVGTRLDTTRADIQLARQRQSLLVATNQRDLARLALLRAIGADLGAGVELTDDWSRLREPVPTLDQALAAARDGRPEMTLLAERLRAAGLLVEAAKAEKLPTVAAQAQAVENGNRVRDLAWNRTFIATVNVPLFTGRRIEARVAEARSQQEQLVLEQRDTERQIEEEVRRALLLLENARSRVELAGQSVRLAEDELEQASDRFKAGVASSIEVDNAQTSLATARDLRIDALADEAQARFDLARATGEIRSLVPSDTASNLTQNARFEGEKKP
jgi:outer membrane protein TolC